MQFGYFAMPSHPPERPLRDGHEWDLQVIRWLDELGFSEIWIGEHHTAPWEPHPAPDLLVAQGLLQTKNIRIGPGGFLLPYHHPAELANRVAMLDHISGGRLNFGVAASGLPSDWAMFNVDGMSGQNRDMTREALDIILKMWSANEPFDYKGKFWHVTNPDTMFGFLKPHIKPLQKPHPPIGVAGLSKNSDTLKLAGERGFLPMSLNLNPAYVASHWDSVAAGAAKAGRKADRNEWRLVREIFVADTDAEAERLSVGLHMGRMMREYFLPLLAQFGFFEYLKHSPDVPDSDVTPEYCAHHNWIIGSPATAAEKIAKIYDDVGGFGQLLVFGFDYVENPQAWRHSLELIAHEVMPRVRHLVPGTHAVAAE
jgi:alkanesulfonate monooxygenase SsuD/methylene tetrahydromethanopterin reductase-like flavin-dependent oxidoreductase (luciferase family)